MLVLRRRAGEAIILGDGFPGGGIEIEVIEISRTRVKLGVRAPREVSVTRREVAYVAVENRKALDLMVQGGAAAVGDLLRLLRRISEESSKTGPDPTDK